jgi:hypothetical protein
VKSARGEEYVRLGRHIEGQFRLIVQVFTASEAVAQSQGAYSR